MSEPQKAIILGASSGIGKEMALRLADDNWRVAITGRRGSLLEKIAAPRPDRLLVSMFDANDVDALPGRLNEIADRLGGLDLLVISAGCGFLNPDLAFGAERDTIATNVLAFTAAADWAYSYFKQQGGGRLAAITSVGGLLGEGMAPAYSASKAYQILYLDSLAKRAAKEKANLAITELRPGSVNTEMMKGEGHFWISSPERAAELACEAIHKGKRLRYISPRWGVIGFLLRCMSLLK